MEDKTDSFKILLEKAQEYGNTSIELFKLRAVDKTVAVVSSIVPRMAAIIILSMIFIMVSIGLSLWLGEIMGKTWYGFFVIAAFYGISGLVVYFLLHNWIKKQVGNFIIKQILQ